jgi:hypothetical protein
MNKDINILQEISPAVANLTKINVYSVQSDYFYNLASEILDQIKLNEFLEEARNNSFIAPNGYFTNLSEEILKSVKNSKPNEVELNDELNTVAPLLSSIQKSNLYSVPESYFTDNIINLIPKKEGKLIQFTKVRKWISYAAAAVIIGVLGTGVIQYMKVTQPAIVIENEVANTSDEEISNYLNNQPHTDFAVNNFISDEHESIGLFEGTNTDDLKQYLNEQPETVENFGDGI